MMGALILGLQGWRLSGTPQPQLQDMIKISFPNEGFLKAVSIFGCSLYWCATGAYAQFDEMRVIPFGPIDLTDREASSQFTDTIAGEVDAYPRLFPETREDFSGTGTFKNWKDGVSTIVQIQQLQGLCLALCRNYPALRLDLSRVMFYIQDIAVEEDPGKSGFPKAEFPFTRDEDGHLVRYNDPRPGQASRPTFRCPLLLPRELFRVVAPGGETGIPFLASICRDLNVCWENPENSELTYDVSDETLVRYCCLPDVCPQSPPSPYPFSIRCYNTQDWRANKWIVVSDRIWNGNGYTLLTVFPEWEEDPDGTPLIRRSQVAVVRTRFWYHGNGLEEFFQQNIAPWVRLEPISGRDQDYPFERALFRCLQDWQFHGRETTGEHPSVHIPSTIDQSISFRSPYSLECFERGRGCTYREIAVEMRDRGKEVSFEVAAQNLAGPRDDLGRELGNFIPSLEDIIRRLGDPRTQDESTRTQDDLLGAMDRHVQALGGCLPWFSDVFDARMLPGYARALGTNLAFVQLQSDGHFAIDLCFGDGAIVHRDENAPDPFLGVRRIILEAREACPIIVYEEQSGRYFALTHDITRKKE
jgi:hypothetical protein